MGIRCKRSSRNIKQETDDGRVGVFARQVQATLSHETASCRHSIGVCTCPYEELYDARVT